MVHRAQDYRAPGGHRWTSTPPPRANGVPRLDGGLAEGCHVGSGGVGAVILALNPRGYGRRNGARGGHRAVRPGQSLGVRAVESVRRGAESEAPGRFAHRSARTTSRALFELGPEKRGAKISENSARVTFRSLTCTASSTEGHINLRFGSSGQLVLMDEATV
jgi:hypothetical protein